MITKESKRRTLLLDRDLTKDHDTFDENFSIEAEIEIKMFSNNRRVESKQSQHQKAVFTNNDTCHKVRLMKWDVLRRRFSADEEVKIELNFRITKLSGVVAKKTLDFGESKKKCSDVTLLVGEEKFYLSKLTLSYQSSYFESMFLGNFAEADKSEVTLQDIDPQEFQKFLEVLHGGKALDDDYFVAILCLVDMFDASIARKQCEDYLMEKSKKSLREKLELAVQYKMENVKAKCLSDMKTADDIRSVVPEKLEKLDPSLMPAILQKALNLLK
ncbi:hypothetical protein GCK72_002882 [Caenorhabditis remanei]|uniref:BTB domain-containing protein n=1 Tax=Caenorhabditis remanei TaxID=31234 RepID=A0A6A5HX78_CAERE|nr:hypothetical protein GCK72_002882 [Caenorhabditis remanei]KAF1771057.1 hypothetical protein GCK72_002882 [Caenorhabditis remanei]